MTMFELSFALFKLEVLYLKTLKIAVQNLKEQCQRTSGMQHKISILCFEFKDV